MCAGNPGNDTHCLAPAPSSRADRSPELSGVCGLCEPSGLGTLYSDALLLQSAAVICCYHLLLSSAAVICCCHLLLSLATRQPGRQTDSPNVNSRCDSFRCQAANFLANRLLARQRCEEVLG
jgi:hypothetical protein